MIHGQAIKAGKIVDGFIECIVIDSTENSLMEASSLKEAFEFIPKETIYFNEDYIVNARIENSKFSLLDYEDRNSGLIYSVYSDSFQKVYVVDSIVFWYLDFPGNLEMLDSIKTKIEKCYISSTPSIINGFTCYEYSASEVKRNEEGYAKIYMTKDLDLVMSRDSPMRKTEGYPFRIVQAAAPGVEVVMGIAEWEKLSSDDPIFKLNLDKYKKISKQEMDLIINKMQ